MATNGPVRRTRSSTTVSRGATAEEKGSEIAGLITDLQQLIQKLENLSFVLQQLRAQISTDDTAKDTFRRCGGLEAIVDGLVASPWSRRTQDQSTVADFTNLCLLLMSTLDEHRGNTRYFTNKLDGWTHFDHAVNLTYKAIEGLEDQQIQQVHIKALCTSLLVLLVGAETHGSIDTNDEIRHAVPGAILIRLASRVQPKHRLTISPFIEAIRTLTSARYCNQVSLWNTGIDSALWHESMYPSAGDTLSEALKDIFDNTAHLGLHDLNDVAELFNQARTSDKARSLLLYLLKETKGPACVQFDLRQYGHSSLELPCLPRAFPPTTGYSFTIWIRFDTFDEACHTTIFGAFDPSQTCFVLLYLERDTHQLILQTSIRSARPSVRFRSTTFETGRWYHIAIVHRKLSPDPKQSPAMLFVDGEFQEQLKCTYPDAPQPRSADVDPRSSNPRAHQIQAFLGTPRGLATRLGRGQVYTSWSFANAHLLQSPLSDEFIAVLRRLGPRYTGNFQDCLGPLLTYKASAELHRYNELLHPDKADKSDILMATEHRGSDVVAEHKLLFSFTSGSVFFLDGRKSGKLLTKKGLELKAHARLEHLTQKGSTVAVNAAVPSLSEAILRSYGTAIFAGDPIVALPKAVDDASWCLAGSIPLLCALLESAPTKKSFLQAAGIFFECVKDNWRISEAMEKSNGFGLLSLIIRQKLGLDIGTTHTASLQSTLFPLPAEDRQSLPYEMLHLILDSVGYDFNAVEKSMIVNPMAYRVLLIDFDTWRHCDRKTVELYYTQFKHFVSRNHHQAFNHKRLTRMRVIKKLVEAMKVEDLEDYAIDHLMNALRGLIDNGVNSTSYKDLAMFVAYILQEERSSTSKPLRGPAFASKQRQHAASLTSQKRMSISQTSSGASPQRGNKRSQLAVSVLQLLTDMLCDSDSMAIRRFVKSVPTRWFSHLLAESNTQIVLLVVRIIAQALALVDNHFKHSFVDKNGGFIAMRSRLKGLWQSLELWALLFGMLIGRAPSAVPTDGPNALQSLLNSIGTDVELKIAHQDLLPAITSVLEAGLRQVVENEQAANVDAVTLHNVLHFMLDLYAGNRSFREFATTSRYAQDLLFVLYPVMVGSDRLSAETELQAGKDDLTFKGEDVVMRPHSNSLTGRPPSVRSLTVDKQERVPSPAQRPSISAPRRLSSFVMVSSGSTGGTSLPTIKFSPLLSPSAKAPVHLNLGNSMVEALLELVTTIFVDQICDRKDFNGIGLFQKVPPGFKEHQAYFESLVLDHTLSQLWMHFQDQQHLLHETKTLTNLGRYAQHLAEAAFEGWFIDGAQSVIDFLGKILEHLQQPQIASLKTVRLCSQAINSMRIVFLRLTLLRLSELDEAVNEEATIKFLHQMNYWQTILFSTSNQETLFTRLICFLLYLKLTSSYKAVRITAVSLWRAVLMQKPTETATLLTYAVGPDQRHLSTGFMKLTSQDDEDFLAWVDKYRAELDGVFTENFAKPWSDFVNEENRRNEETAKARLSKRREKLRVWHAEETSTDQFLLRYETSTSHWRSNVHAQERLKTQRAAQDHQESVNHMTSILSKQERQLTQPCGPFPSNRMPRWRLDETEGLNRMRMRLLVHRHVPEEKFQPKRKASVVAKLKIDTAAQKLSSNINTPFTPGSDGARDEEKIDYDDDRPRRESISNSQLLEGGFEMVEDPKEDEDGVVEDKNRKILTNLQRGDMVQQLYNISRFIGLEACEGLLVVGKRCLYLQDSYFLRSDGEIVSVSQAPEDERDPYLRMISGKDVQRKQNLADSATRHWSWSEVLSISKRRFLLRDVSLEVFFTDGRSYLLTCLTTKTRDELYNAVVTRAPHVHGATTVASEDAWRLDNLRNPEETPSTIGSRFATVFSGGSTHTATKKWMKGEMSNFQYLMLINTMAGRSFNDLTQYPVFPWVLADYDSEELDLTDPRTFRDLSKPMGCQTTAREAEFRDRYHQFASMGDHNAPAFNYGTHYSSAMIVCSYLIRLQPFVQSYLLLQGGKFDHADRLFDSVERAWHSASRDNMSDVRELTPEFFYLPEFLTNVNEYDFGTKQGNGGVVNHVKLPRWAKGDPHIFIAKHREALECSYVSERLHHWIDLIFGYKQRGELAVAAANVFHHLSYGGSKDLDTIQDDVERLASIGIIHSFGQTPHQVFQKPHPARDPDRMTSNHLDAHVESLIRLPDPLFHSDDRVVQLVHSKVAERLLCSGSGKSNVLPNFERYLQWKIPDNSARFFNASKMTGLYENIHIGEIKSAIFADSKTLITAGADCTLAIWNINSNREWIEMQSSAYLFGHRSAVTVVVASKIFSTILSASEDGQVVLWDLNRHICLRVMRQAGAGPVQTAQISNLSGHIAVCCSNELFLYTINGHLLLRQKICEPLDDIICCAFYEGTRNEWVERELLFTSHTTGVVNAWSLISLSDGTWHLQLVNRLNHLDVARHDTGNIAASITAILPTANAVYTGDEIGRIWQWDVIQKQGITTVRQK